MKKIVCILLVLILYSCRTVERQTASSTSLTDVNRDSIGTSNFNMTEAEFFSSLMIAADSLEMEFLPMPDSGIAPQQPAHQMTHPAPVRIRAYGVRAARNDSSSVSSTKDYKSLVVSETEHDEEQEEEQTIERKTDLKSWISVLVLMAILSYALKRK